MTSTPFPPPLGGAFDACPQGPEQGGRPAATANLVAASRAAAGAAHGEILFILGSMHTQGAALQGLLSGLSLVINVQRQREAAALARAQKLPRGASAHASTARVLLEGGESPSWGINASQLRHIFAEDSWASLLEVEGVQVEARPPSRAERHRPLRHRYRLLCCSSATSTRPLPLFGGACAVGVMGPPLARISFWGNKRTAITRHPESRRLWASR